MSWEFIPPYSLAHGGAWESLVKVFKRALLEIVKFSQCTPNLVELQTYIANTTRLVNNRPLTPLSVDPLQSHHLHCSPLHFTFIHPLVHHTTLIIYPGIFVLTQPLLNAFGKDRSNFIILGKMDQILSPSPATT